jgi:hypothetical protein
MNVKIWADRKIMENPLFRTIYEYGASQERLNAYQYYRTEDEAEEATLEILNRNAEKAAQRVLDELSRMTI